MLSDVELLRYNRQILLGQWDIAAQEKIKASKVLIIGMGGLGCPAALYLASAGVGELHLVDFDTVELSNLQRQILYRLSDIGQPKAIAAAQHLQQVNPHCQIKPMSVALNDDNLYDIIQQVDLVLDCTDNFATRDAINRACVLADKPLISAAAIGLNGQLASFYGSREWPCYRCLYPEANEQALSCSEAGVLASVVGVMGSLQAHEALTCLSGLGSGLFGKLTIWEADIPAWRTVKLRKDPHCPVCGPLKNEVK
ncbi:HesA/MoeB/ThiF family protein [Agitococcus lubricus]|uniref:Molybdopterin-synthase adenylyltransferase n=1 Tax=Agitococcus lubricus TaxID=1077255 RepID=A0A2T5ITQ3_9GAMM|nr:molybdopterin-synthase adenylyltransferase MoeB [Agitococcus lubricus]PTQ87225.1 adenylyltransferase/sulfurtransferase [Agitococcus lubricus]